MALPYTEAPADDSALLGRMREIADNFAAMLGAVPGAVSLEPPAQPAHGPELRWRNQLFAAPCFRRAHVELLDIANHFAVVHVVVLPHLARPEPIFGFDMIAGRAQATGIFLDVSPVTAAPPNPSLGDTIPASVRARFANGRTRPDWGSIFSADFLPYAPMGRPKSSTRSASRPPRWIPISIASRPPHRRRRTRRCARATWPMRKRNGAIRTPNACWPASSARRRRASSSKPCCFRCRHDQSRCGGINSLFGGAVAPCSMPQRPSDTMMHLARLGAVLNFSALADAERRQTGCFTVLAATAAVMLGIVAFSPAAAMPAIIALAAVAALLLHAATRTAPPPQTSFMQNAGAEEFADELRRDAEIARRRQAMQGMADALELHLTALVAQVGGRAQEMRGIADAVAAIAEKSGENIVVTRTAADDSVDAARALSITTAQLERSIASISTQMEEANSVAASAVAVGVETRHAMSQLTGQLGAVRSVTDRIAGLAKQTNLLALNATIEAARAGAAGSGFAVVAAEVKALARQTAELTQEIGQIIGAVGAVNHEAVEKVDQMEQRIIHIENIAAAIAREVEEQRTTTAAISSSVAQTAGAADQLSNRVDALTESMMENLDQTANVHVSATALVADADEMEASLRRTITKAVRNAVPESDRRRFPRYPVSDALQQSLACRLEIAGQQLPFRLLDLSDAGCRLIVPNMPGNCPDMTLAMAGLATPLRLKIVSRETSGDQEILGVQFTSQCVQAEALASASF